MSPLREYDCDKCGKRFETLVRGKEDDDTKCPDCGNRALQQCFSFPSTYQIKGDNSASVRPKRMGGDK